MRCPEEVSWKIGTRTGLPDLSFFSTTKLEMILSISPYSWRKSVRRVKIASKPLCTQGIGPGNRWGKNHLQKNTGSLKPCAAMSLSSLNGGHPQDRWIGVASSSPLRRLLEFRALPRHPRPRAHQGSGNRGDLSWR